MVKRKSYRGSPDLGWKELMAEIREAKKDPEFMKDLREFIRVTSS